MLALYGALAAMCLAMTAVIGTTVMLAVAVTTAGPPEQSGTLTLNGIGERLTVLPILLCLIVVQTAAEEVVTRGVILQAVGRFTRSPWPAVLVQAAVFTALHGAGEVSGMVGVLVVGVALGWITVRTGGLAAAIAFHIVVNSLAALTAVVYGATSPTDNAATGSWPQALILGGTTTGYVLLVNLLIRPLGVTTTVRDLVLRQASDTARISAAVPKAVPRYPSASPSFESLHDQEAHTPS
ncbi:CPBP family intramembrane glutamic endopeptidase [Verrucosispora sp. NA02020]|uniref:CPBP family intramembrane glutamic endopeptidase n=1 Tax=Verrucosispora sp. NA02020 TaxID=2742132 RepID=UPI0015923D49|nr:CPBP family intramembrane glutamic endopeptidase [Verrucosispora sp. NA02020]QKW12200.1 CPBP family intramembrane metalloprotease [Verrucosispora sp. NA02020]